MSVFPDDVLTEDGIDPNRPPVCRMPRALSNTLSRDCQKMRCLHFPMDRLALGYNLKECVNLNVKIVIIKKIYCD